MTAAHEVGDIGTEVLDALRRAHLARALALFEVLQEAPQDHGGLSGCALVFADDGERLALHAPPFPFVLEESADSCGKLLSIVHRDAGIPLREEYMRILEVEHVVPDDDRLAVRRRLQDVVTTVRDEAAANVDDVADAVDSAELTDRIEDHNVMIFARFFQKFCTARDGKSLVPAERGDFRRAQKLPRRNDELGLGELFPECGKRLEDRRLLTAMRAACEKNATILAKSHFTQELFLLREAHIRVRLIELRIPRDGHKFRRCAETHDVLGVDGRLHGELSNRADHVIKDAVQMLVALDALVADAPVDHHDGNLELLRRPQEVRPKLRLDGHEDARMDATQNAARAPRKIERKVDDAVRILDNAVRHLVARRRDDGDEDRALREFLVELSDQGAGSDDLADGRRMNPYTVLLCHLVERVLRKEAEALAHALDEAALAHGANEEHGYDEDDGEDRREIVE